MRRLPLLFLLAAVAVLAAPTARSQRSARTGAHDRARQVLAQVDALDRQVEQIAETYDLAGVDLASTRRSLRANARELRLTNRNLSRAQAALAHIVVAKYEDGEADSTIAVVLGATSLNDLIDRLNATELIARQDASVIAQVRRFRRRALAERQRLRHEQVDKQALRQALSQRRTEIDGQLAERRRLLSSIEGEVARLQAQERIRQDELRRKAETRLAATRARVETHTLPDAAADPPPPAQSSTEGGSDTTRSQPTSSPPPTRHAHVVPILMGYLGTRYQWGGASPNTGFDCSGLVLYVYAQVGVSLPHNAALQYGYGTPVDRDELEPGDIVFFNDLGHDGVYIGGGQFIDAPKTGDVVKIENLNDPWWTASYVGARRLP